MTVDALSVFQAQKAAIALPPGQRLALFNRLVGCSVAGHGLSTAILPPLLHRRPHGQKLVLELGAGVTRQQVQLQRDVIRQLERSIFARDQQRCGFAAGAS